MEGGLLSEPLNLDALLSKGTTFSVDAEEENIDIYDEDSEEDAVDKLFTLENETYRNILARPGAVKFAELAAQMIECAQCKDVKILILEEGDGHLVPRDAMVTLHYSAYWENESEPFDCSLENNNGRPVRKRLGDGYLLPGIEIGLAMVKGPKARFQLLLDPKVCWGALGCMERIRAEPALFCVTLLDVEDTGSMDKFNNLTESEQRSFDINMESAKSTGNHAKKLFNKRNYSESVKHYNKCLYILQLCDTKNEEELTKVKAEIKKMYTNIALCYLKLNKPNKALKFLDEFSRNNDLNKECKAMFYYGKAFAMLGDYENSLKFLNKSLALEPNNSDIGSYLSKIEEQLHKSEKEFKNMCTNMFKTNSGERKKFTAKNLFEREILTVCDDLSKTPGLRTFPLPEGLSRDEVESVREICASFDKLELVLNENACGERFNKIVKKA